MHVHCRVTQQNTPLTPVTSHSALTVVHSPETNRAVALTSLQRPQYVTTTCLWRFIHATTLSIRYTFFARTEEQIPSQFRLKTYTQPPKTNHISRHAAAIVTG